MENMEFIHFVWVLLYVIPTILAEFQCKAQINGCVCLNFAFQKTYEISCLMDELKINIQVKSDSKAAKIQCFNEVNWDHQGLPSTELEDLEYLEFSMCPFPTDSFTEVMNKLRINGTKALKFIYFENLENVTLTSGYFEGAQYLEKLMLCNNNLRNIDEDAFKLLDKLTYLDLSSNKLQLTDRLFKNLRKLTLLDMANNELTYLPLTLFQNLTELKSLFLWSNKLTTLDNSVFENLKNLELLELSNNQLQNLPENVFYRLRKLRKLSLSQNNLNNLPENMFVENTLIEDIRMGKNPHLTQLPNNLFANLTKLRSVLLNECKITSLPTNVFDASINMQDIYLQMNQIKHVPEKIFEDLIELQLLDMSYNQIEDLPDEIFSSLIKLKTLNLQDNMLTSIRSKHFSSLQNLETINLKNNKISFIHTNSFQQVVNLKEVIMSNNYISFHESKTPHMSPFSLNAQLEKIDLSSNNITTISNDFSFMVNLQELDLSNNQIGHLDFVNLLTVSYSIRIDLRNNNITTVYFDDAEYVAGLQERNAFAINNRVVYLDGNPIACDCLIYHFTRYFDGSINPIVPALVRIEANDLTCKQPSDLSGVPVKKLNSIMLVCPLHQLGIDAEIPEKCTYEVRLWDQSLIVNCSDGNLTKVPNLILPKDILFERIEVYLQRNSLKSGPSQNMGYENVTKMVLSFNHISEVTWVPPKIKVLELDNNNIRYIKDDILSTLNASSLSSLTLGNNPWKCDCSAENLKTFLISQLLNTNLQFDANNMKCRSDGNFLVNVECPPTLDTVMILGITLASLVPAIAILFAVFMCGKRNS